MTGGVYIESEEETLAHCRSALNWAGEAVEILLERPEDDVVSKIDLSLRLEALEAMFWAFCIYTDVATCASRTYVREGFPHALIFDMADHSWSYGPLSGQGAVSAIAAMTGEPPAEIARRICELVGQGLFAVMAETIEAIGAPDDKPGVGA
ncbi:hypothetical protein [Methylocella sp.]|uniref:hypothetical protein n=1 Tax=Methylocella sp. TaxID=1978226 RepID=UPI003784CC57